MKIAFVGKGGSGKSTVTTLFVQHLIEQNQRVLAVDADINQHLASLLGVSFDPAAAISQEAATALITSVLAGTNERVESAHMVKTTPPGRGSHLIRLRAADPILARCSVGFGKGRGHFMHVGTYDEDGIGTSCYHGNLAVFENIVSHTDLATDEWLIADMVAGTDAFAGALYLMFDAIVLVVEPTPESVGVYRQFMRLAQASGVQDRVYVAANKVADEDDEVYLTDALAVSPAAVFAYDAVFKRVRQRGEALVTGTQAYACESLRQRVTQTAPDKFARLQELHTLHRHYAGQGYVRDTHGDLTGQIDDGFRL